MKRKALTPPVHNCSPDSRGIVSVVQLSEELRTGVTSLNSPQEQVRDVISQQLGCNVLNCVSDINCSVASFIYNRLVEEFMVALDSTLVSLVRFHRLTTRKLLAQVELSLTWK